MFGIYDRYKISIPTCFQNLNLQQRPDLLRPELPQTPIYHAFYLPPNFAVNLSFTVIVYIRLFYFAKNQLYYTV